MLNQLRMREECLVAKICLEQAEEKAWCVEKKVLKQGLERIEQDWSGLERGKVEGGRRKILAFLDMVRQGLLTSEAEVNS